MKDENMKVAKESIDEGQITTICETLKLIPNIVKFTGEDEGKYVTETHIFNSQDNRKIGQIEMPVWFMEDLIKQIDETSAENVLPWRRKKGQRRQKSVLSPAHPYPISMNKTLDDQPVSTQGGGEIAGGATGGYAGMEDETNINSAKVNPIYSKILSRMTSDKLEKKDLEDEELNEKEDNLEIKDPENIVSEVDPIDSLKDQIRQLKDGSIDDVDDTEITVTNKQEMYNSPYKKLLKKEADINNPDVQTGPINIDKKKDEALPPEVRDVDNEIERKPANKSEYLEDETAEEPQDIEDADNSKDVLDLVKKVLDVTQPKNKKVKKANESDPVWPPKAAPEKKSDLEILRARGKYVIATKDNKPYKIFNSEKGMLDYLEEIDSIDSVAIKNPNFKYTLQKYYPKIR